MASGDIGDPLVEEGAIPLDIDNIQMLLQVEQEQIQKRTFTNWINAQLSKRAPPSVVSDLFADLHDGTRLLDLLEVVSGQRLKREKGQGLFQSRSNIETALNFLKKKSIKLVNIHIPDIIDGRPSIVLGLIWSIILHCHIEELASSLSFSSRQSSLESLASMDSSRDSPVQPRASPLHAQFRLSAKKALLLWVREQCDRASCSLNIKDFKSSWRSGVAFLAILHSLRPDLVDLSQVETRTNQQNLEEAFRIAEQELRIPRLLEPEDVDIQDPDEKSIMTYVAQFLQYSKEQPAPEAADAEASANQKRREVTCWLQKTYQELVEAWASTEDGSYVERYQAFQMSARPFEDQRRHILPMLSSVRGPAQSGEELRALRQAWDVLAEKVQQCERALDVGLPAPLGAVGRWLLQVESALTEGDRHTQDHAHAAQEAREKRELLKTSMKELDLHLQTLQTFHNKDEYGSTLVPADKLDQLSRRFTSARVTAKYHGMKLDYWECRHSLLELLAQADSRLRSWRAAYNSQDAVHLRLQDWHEAVDKHGLILHLKAALHKMKEVASNYTSKAALAEDSKRVSRQLKEAEMDTGVRIEAVIGAKSTMERIMSAWDTYNDSLSSVQAWLGQEAPKILSHGTEVTPECLEEWSARHAHLNEVGNYLTEVTEPGTSRALAAQLQVLNKEWAIFINKTRFSVAPPPSGPSQRPPAVQSLTQDATLLMTEQVEVSSGPLRAYRKKLQLMMKKVKDVDLDALAASPDWSAESQQKLRQSVHEVTQELCRAEQASDKLQRSASALESRLAELQHWETEAWEVYQLLKEGEKRGQRGHLPKAKALIARALHLEGQLVAEEQDYMAAVTAVRSSGPLLCLSVSELQDRVRHSLAQAQEAVGMLSSVGTRRHQGPAESQPPPKILILSPTEGQPLSQTQSAVHPQSQTTALHQHHIEFQYQSQTKPQHHIVPITQPQTDPKPEHQTDPKPQHSTDSKSKPERQTDTKPQHSADSQSKPEHQTDTKPQHHVDPTPKPQAPVNPPPQSQPVFRPYTYAQAVTQSHSRTTIQPQGQTQTQSRSLTHSEAHIQTQTHSQVPDPVLAQNKPQPQSPQVPHPTQPSAMTHNLRSPHSQPRPQPQPWPHDQAPFPPNPQASTRPKDRPQSQAQVPLQDSVPASVQALPCAQPQTYIQAVPTARTDTQSQAPAFTGPSTKTYTEALTGHPSCTLNKSPTSTFPQVHSDAPRAQLPQWHTVTYAGPLPQAPTVALRGQTQPGVLTGPIPEAHSDAPMGQSSQAYTWAPTGPVPQAHTEVLTGNLHQALNKTMATERFEKAKHRLQDHIFQAITFFSDKQVSKEQAAQKEASLQLLNPKVLEEFLRSSDDLRRFCSQAELRDMEVQSHTVRKQWEAVRSEIAAYLQHLKFEVERGHFNTAALQCETLVHINPGISTTDPASAEEQAYLHAEAGRRLVALKTLCDTVSPEETRLAARAQLKECERRLETVQMVTEHTPLTAASFHGQPSTAPLCHTDSSEGPLGPKYAQAIVKADNVGIKQMAERTVIQTIPLEDETATQEDLERYRASCSAFKSQLDRNQQGLQSEFPSGPATPSALRIHLQQLQVLKQDTEGLWFEFELQYSQCSQLKGVEHSLEKERNELLQQWRAQQIHLQRRVKSLGAAMGLLSPVDNQMTLIAERLDHLFEKPKDIHGFTLTNPSAAEEDIKDLEEKIQREMDRLTGLDREDSQALRELDPEAWLALGHALVGSRQTLDQLRQRVWRGGAAVRALDRFLLSLRGVERDISSTRVGVPVDISAPRDGRSRLAPIRQSVRAAGDEAAQVDRLLEEARFSLTRDGSPTSCQDLVVVLSQRLEEADGCFAHQLQEGSRANSAPLGERRRAMMRVLQDIRSSVESQGLKEPTLPAVQRRMRNLADMEARLAAQRTEMQGLREATAQMDPKSSQGNPMEELETLWEEVNGTVTERREQCRALTELLKRFQSCRSNLCTTLQRAEQTVSERASYMGKDNLQRLISKVHGIKDELAGLAQGVEEIRGVCRQLQAQLRMFPDCADAPFDSEADDLVDRWLDVTEKTESHMDSLQVGVELWAKLMQLGGEVESWTDRKLAMFTEGHPFHSEQDIKALQDEIRDQEESLERFHKRSSEIQELLQSKEPPLDLQVMETQLRKKIEQVHELFSESSDVFQCMVVARERISQRMAECQSALRDIQTSLSTLDTSQTPSALSHIQALSAQLQLQAEQTDSILEEVKLLLGVASPQALDKLAVQGRQLKEGIHSTQDLIGQKRLEVQKGPLKVTKSHTKASQQVAQVAPVGEEVDSEVMQDRASAHGRNEGHSDQTGASQHARVQKSKDMHAGVGKTLTNEKPSEGRKQTEGTVTVGPHHDPQGSAGTAGTYVEPSWAQVAGVDAGRGKRAQTGHTKLLITGGGSSETQSAALQERDTVTSVTDKIISAVQGNTLPERSSDTASTDRVRSQHQAPVLPLRSTGSEGTDSLNTVTIETDMQDTEIQAPQTEAQTTEPLKARETDPQQAESGHLGHPEKVTSAIQDSDTKSSQALCGKETTSQCTGSLVTDKQVDSKISTQRTSGRVCEKKVVSIGLDTNVTMADAQYSELLPCESTESVSMDPPTRKETIKPFLSDSSGAELRGSSGTSGAGLKGSSDSSGAGLKGSSGTSGVGLKESSGVQLRGSRDVSVTGFSNTSETSGVTVGPCKHPESALTETAVQKPPQTETDPERTEADLHSTTEALQSQRKTVALILDTDALHVQTPEARGSTHADVLRILSSGGQNFPAAPDMPQAEQTAVLCTKVPERQCSANPPEQVGASPGETSSMDPTLAHTELEEQTHSSQSQHGQTPVNRAAESDEKKKAEDAGISGHPDSVISVKVPGEREGPAKAPVTGEDARPAPIGQEPTRHAPCTSGAVHHIGAIPDSYIMEVEGATVRLDQLQAQFQDCSEIRASLEELQSMLRKMGQFQKQLECESQALVVLGIRVSRSQGDSAHQGQAKPVTLMQELQAMKDRCRTLREKCILGQQSVQAEIRERAHAQEEIRAMRVQLVAKAALLTGQGQHSSARILQEVRKELDSHNAVLQAIMGGLKRKYLQKQTPIPVEMQGPLQEVARLLMELQGKVEDLAEKNSPLHKLGCKVKEVMEGLQAAQDLLQQKSASVPEAQIKLKRVWDALDRWHSRLAVLEGEVQDVGEEQPDQAPLLMDKLMEPLQLYQQVAKQAEQRTAFLSKVPTLLQEYEEMIGSSGRWLSEAQSMLTMPITYTTAKCLSNHAQGLQAVLDDSEQMRRGLQGFASTLQEMSTACNTTAMEQRLAQADRRIAAVHQGIQGPLSQLQDAASEVAAIEGEVKLMEKNVSKIQSILSSIDSPSISPEEHLRNRQVILDNIQSMKRTIAEIQKCRSELDLPIGARETLSVFHRAQQLLQPTHDLEQLTQEQSSALMAIIGQPMAYRQNVSSTPQGAMVSPTSPLALPGNLQGSWQIPPSHERHEDEEEDRGSSHSSSSETFTGSVPEEPDEASTGEGHARHAGPAGARAGALVGNLSRDEAFEHCSIPSAKELLGESRLLRQGDETQAAVLQAPSQLDPTQEVVVSCREWASQLEDWLSRTWQHLEGLGPTEAMQDTIKQQFITYLEMLQEKQRKVSQLAMDQQRDAVGKHTELEALSSRLDLLKTSMLSLQLLLQKRWSKDLKGMKPGECPLEEGMSDSTSMTQTSSDSSKQQSSLQQWRIDVDLYEQRGLAQAIAGYYGGKRPTCLSDESQIRTRSYDEPVGGVLTQEERALLCTQLEAKLRALEELRLEGPLEVTLQVPESHKSLQVEGPHTQHHPSSGPDEETKMQTKKDSSSGQIELKGSTKQQEGPEELLQVLNSLVELGRERLVHSQIQPRSRDDLQTLLNRQKKYFQALGGHMAALGYLWKRVPEETQRQVEGVREKLEREVGTLQQQAAWEGAKLQRTLEAWVEWDKSSSQLEELLQDVEARLPSGGSPEETKGQLTTCQEVKEVLDQSGTQLLHRALDQGKELQASGHCPGVGVALWGLETRWLAAQRGAEQERSHAEELRDLWSRFQQDSATLGTWMDGAGERLQMLTELVAAAPQETGHHRAHLAQLLELTKEAGAMSTVKTSLSRTGAQLLQLKGDHPSSVQTQLEQLEQRWVGMLAAQSGVQERLHKLLMEKLSQEEVMAELGVWMEDLKSRLGEDKERILRASDASSLGPLLQHCKEYKVEMGLHQLSLDFISQSVVPTGSPEDVLERRYEWNSFAERLGILHLYWLTLQGVLASQDHNVEQLQQICADRENRLQCLCSWVRGHRERMEKLQKPGSLSQAQRAGQECEHTEQELKVKCVEMQELRESCRPVEGGGEQQSDCDAAFITQTDSVRQDFTALSQQISAMWPMLRQVVGQWEQFEEALGEALLGTAKIRQALELIRTPHLCLHTLLGHAHRLQLLQEEAQGQEEVWEALRRTWSSLRDEVSPAAAVRLSQRLEEGRTRWVTVCLELTEELQKSQALIESWRAYTTLYDAFVLQLHSHRVQWGALMSNPLQGDDAVKPTQAQMEAVSELQAGMEGLHSSLGAVLEASKKLIGKVEPQASALIQSETQMLSQDVARLAGDLLLRQKQLQEQLDLRQDFHSCLESLEQRLRGDESRLSSTPEHKLNPKLLKTRLLELTDLTSDLDSLNELGRSIALSDRTSRRLQELRMLWSRTSSHAVEMSCKLQAGALLRQNFGQKCESWVNFLQGVEESLPKEDAAGRSLDPLPRQLAALRRLQVQVPEGCQILNSIIKEGLGLLDKDEVEDRCGFVQKLVQQMERWQGTVWRVRQQLAVAQGMKGQQQVYTHGLKMLKGLLSNTDHLLTPTNPSHCSLHQLRQSLEEVKDAERQFQQHHSLYLQTVETGRALLTQGSMEMQAQLQDELEALQEAWEHSQGTLGKRRANTEAVLQNWECSQARIADSRCRLEGVKNRLKQPLPELLGELHTTEKLNKEAEGSLEEWSHGFAEITHERTNLEQQVAPGDMALLQKPEEALSREWEELCLKVSQRKQEIANRLGTWTIFNEKKQELCAWLTQMEKKHSPPQDCMEEMHRFREDKTRLRQLGERLIASGDRAQEAEDMLRNVEDRWKHVAERLKSRVTRLQQWKERVKKLQRDMCVLQTQLSRTETQLATPLSYSTCHSDEIQRKLTEQKALEQEVQQQSEGVASVLAQCDSLAEDADGCGGDLEVVSLREKARSLNNRCRNIRTLTTQRRSRIKETRQLWREFLDDHSKFEDWLRKVEETAAKPDSDYILYANAKEECKKFEALQREGQEHFANLELLNTRYRRLARENRTDTANSLQVTVLQGNQRWDTLQQRVVAILRRLKSFTAEWEEFVGVKEKTQMWLTEMDLRLTNVEHLSKCDTHERMEQLDGLQREMGLGVERVAQLTSTGKQLRQRSAPQDRALIQEQLSYLSSFHQQLLQRAERFRQRLTCPRPETEEEPEDQSGPGQGLEGGAVLAEGSWQEGSRDGQAEQPIQQASSHPLALPQESLSLGSTLREGECACPSDVDQSSPQKEEDERATMHGAISGTSLTEAPILPSPESQKEEEYLHKGISLTMTAPPTHASTPCKQGYAELVSECSGSIDHVKRVSLILDDEEQLPAEQGLTGLAVADKQSGVIQRWEVLQAQSPQPRVPREPPRPTSDLSDITAWLGRVVPELQQLQRSKPATSIRDMEASVKRLKEMQRTFSRYKGVMIALNLGSQEPQPDDDGKVSDEGLQNMNQSWVEACILLEQWEERLRGALMRCKEFHKTLQSLLLWLASAESRRLAVDVHDPSVGPTALQEHNNALMGLEKELQVKQQQVNSLQEISTQLLLEGGAAGGAGRQDGGEAQEKLHVIGNKLQLLLSQVASDQEVIKKRLEQEKDTAVVRQPAGNRNTERRDPSPPRSFFQRVLRAAFPLHLLLLLLLTLACLVPAWEEDSSCLLSNNFARSLYPMLRYTQGPPPT